MSRIKRGASWCAILATFTVFSVLMLGGMAGVGTAATVSQAAAKLEKSGKVSKGKGSFVVLKANGMFDRLSGRKTVCWVTNAQLARIQARWKTTVSVVDGRPVARVYAPHTSVNAMRKYVSGTEIHCVLVHKRQTFFLPIEGAVS